MGRNMSLHQTLKTVVVLTVAYITTDFLITQRGCPTLNLRVALAGEVKLPQKCFFDSTLFYYTISRPDEASPGRDFFGSQRSRQMFVYTLHTGQK